MFDEYGGLAREASNKRKTVAVRISLIVIGFLIGWMFAVVMMRMGVIV